MLIQAVSKQNDAAKIVCMTENENTHIANTFDDSAISRRNLIFANCITFIHALRVFVLVFLISSQFNTCANME